MKICSLLLRPATMLAAILGFFLLQERVVAAESPAVAPTPGRDLAATPVSSTEIVLTWTPTPHDFTYAITRMGPDGQPHQFPTLGRTSSFHDRALEPDTTYTYLVRASSGIAATDEFMVATAHTAGWQNQDVGQVGAAGSVQRAGAFITVTGSGADIDGSADAFHFLHEPWSGDGTLIVRVNRIANTAPWAKAGLMFRESLAPGSRHVMVAANPTGNSALLARGANDGPTQVSVSNYSNTPQWLKLVRQGNTFQAFQSGDGTNWGFVGSITVDLPATVHAGLAVTSHNAGVPSAAVFDGFNLSAPWDTGSLPLGAPNVQARITDIILIWPHSYASGSLVELSLDNFRTMLPTPRVGFDTYGTIIYDVEPGTTYYIRVRQRFADGLGLSSPIISTTTLPAPSGITKPAAPTSLSANVVSSSQVNLMWSDNSGQETNFLVELSSDGWNFTGAGGPGPNGTSFAVQHLLPDTTYHFRVRATYTAVHDNVAVNIRSDASNVVRAKTFLTPAGSPSDVSQPPNITVSPGTAASIKTLAAGSNSYQWRRNGIDVPNASSDPSYYFFPAFQPSDTGIYTAVITNAGGSVETDPAIVGLTLRAKLSGAAREVGTDIRHPNGNTYDQVLLEGAAASITANPGQVTRISYVDLNDDIVQVEFSGAGTLTITLDNASGPAPAQKYNQPDVSYMKGHATLTIAEPNETTYVSVFSVGRDNAVNQALFRNGTSYDGVADLALISIMNQSGRFGGVFAGDAHFFSTRSLTGIYAPNVKFEQRVIVSDITAHDRALPMLLLGQATDVQIAGGSLAQPSGRPVQVGMFDRIQFVAGTKSSGQPMPAESNQARFEQNGRDVTATMTSSSTP